MSDPLFHAISIAPDIVHHCHLLRFPLAVLRGKDNGWDFAGSVQRVWWAGDLALAQTRHALYLLPADSIPRPAVSAYELAILRGLAAGLNIQAIAQQIHLVEGSIHRYSLRLRTRLGANHSPHLIAIAKDQGLI
jgi:DNA-binding NarL/FixJ family response regulator